MPSRLEEIRQIAKASGLREIFYNEESRVVSFVPARGNTNPLTRLNVYFTTMTVGTCIDHPFQGKTQLFRRNVTLEQLKEIALDPRIHTGQGYRQVVKQEKRTREEEAHDSMENVTLGEEAELREELKRLLDRAEMIKEALKGIEEKRRKEEAEAEEKRQQEAAEAEEVKRTAALEARGTCYDYLLNESCRLIFDKGFNDSTKIIALGGDMIFGLEDNGSMWWSGLPKQLDNKLRGRQKSLPPPRHVAIGPNDLYYVKFEDGSSQWSGSLADCDCESLRKNDVKRVAFGADENKIFILHENGGYSHRGIPDELASIVEKSYRKSVIEDIALGPNGEYYMRCRNGFSCWQGDQSFLRAMAKYKNWVTSVGFGDDNQYFIRYKQ